ncbi:hypothetical protein ACN47E_005041 [Coniothyrium glycines]
MDDHRVTPLPNRPHVPRKLTQSVLSFTPRSVERSQSKNVGNITGRFHLRERKPGVSYDVRELHTLESSNSLSVGCDDTTTANSQLEKEDRKHTVSSREKGKEKAYVSESKDFVNISSDESVFTPTDDEDDKDDEDEPLLRKTRLKKIHTPALDLHSRQMALLTPAPPASNSSKNATQPFRGYATIVDNRATILVKGHRLQGDIITNTVSVNGLVVLKVGEGAQSHTPGYYKHIQLITSQVQCVKVKGLTSKSIYPT